MPSPGGFSKFLYRQHFTGVVGMFSLDPFLENGHVFRKICDWTAIHLVGTRAAGGRARHALWRESISALLDFLVELLFSDHVTSVCLCHASSLPQLSVRAK